MAGCLNPGTIKHFRVQISDKLNVRLNILILYRNNIKNFRIRKNYLGSFRMRLQKVNIQIITLNSQMFIKNNKTNV